MAESSDPQLDMMLNRCGRRHLRFIPSCGVVTTTASTG